MYICHVHCPLAILLHQLYLVDVYEFLVAEGLRLTAAAQAMWLPAPCKPAHTQLSHIRRALIIH